MIQNINVQKNKRKSNANRCILFAYLAVLPGFNFYIIAFSWEHLDWMYNYIIMACLWVLVWQPIIRSIYWTYKALINILLQSWWNCFDLDLFKSFLLAAAITNKIFIISNMLPWLVATICLPIKSFLLI